VGVPAARVLFLALAKADSGPALGPIIIPAVATLAGVALGRFWDVFGEKKRWRRDQCSKAYAEFSACADAFFVEVGVDDDHVDWGRAQTAYVGQSQAGAMVDVFGTTAVADAAHLVWNWAAYIMNDWDSYMAMDDNAWLEPAARFRVLLLAFTNAVREHLGDKKRIAITEAIAASC
jgi:hypothetical protein